MLINYEIVTTPSGNTGILATNNENGMGLFIPTDPANSDYQAYLAYVANGNQTPTIQ